MAPIGAHRCILAKFRRGELRVLQVCAGLIFNKSVHFLNFASQEALARRAIGSLIDASIYIRRSESGIFHRAAIFFEIFFGMKGVIEKREGKAGARQLNQPD